MVRKVWVELDPFTQFPIRIFRSHKDMVEKMPYMEDGPTAQMSRARAVHLIRDQVWWRTGGECQDCGDTVPLEAMHMHEKIHRGQGGEISLDNSVCLCAKCHLDIEHGNRKPRFGEK